MLLWQIRLLAIGKWRFLCCLGPAEQGQGRCPSGAEPRSRAGNGPSKIPEGTPQAKESVGSNCRVPVVGREQRSGFGTCGSPEKIVSVMSAKQACFLPVAGTALEPLGLSIAGPPAQAEHDE